MFRPRLNRISQWIDRINQDNPAAAEEFGARIDRILQMINRHPEAGHSHPRKKEIRYIVEAPFKIFLANLA